MPDRAFPVIYTTDVARSVRFYTRLGFEVRYQFPPDGEAGYVSLRRGSADLGLVDASSPRELLGAEVGQGPRFEMFIYVEDVDTTLDALRRDGARVVREPEDMPWGERVGYLADPDGNPVALAASVRGAE